MSCRKRKSSAIDDRRQTHGNLQTGNNDDNDEDDDDEADDGNADVANVLCGRVCRVYLALCSTAKRK